MSNNRYSTLIFAAVIIAPRLIPFLNAAGVPRPPPNGFETRACGFHFAPARAFHIAVRSSPQISLGGGVKANTLCAGNDARRTLQSQQLVSALQTRCAREIS